MSKNTEILGLVFAIVGVLQHVVIVASVVVDVLVLRDEMNVEDADVDSQPRLAVPVEV